MTQRRDLQKPLLMPRPSAKCSGALSSALFSGSYARRRFRHRRDWLHRPGYSYSLALSASELAPLFGAGLLGLTAGALLCGPLADRFWPQAGH